LLFITAPLSALGEAARGDRRGALSGSRRCAAGIRDPSRRADRRPERIGVEA
jgi:hypothetical protein